jgi:starch synthase
MSIQNNNMSINKILFVSSEVHPIIKTGGLADVSGSLPLALKTLRRDLRILMPAYADALNKITKPREITRLKLPGMPEPVRLLETKLKGSSVPVWLVDAPALFDRPGNPYLDENGQDWPDNAQRFALFAHAAVAIAMGKADLDWRPDLVHCNDWQTGLIPALLHNQKQRPATVFTIHNLAYQGLFDWDTFIALKLPKQLWSMAAMEFYNQFSFIKGGIVFADKINTVSPKYAEEIRTPEYGYGLDKLLESRASHLSGILNGVDYSHWNPARDRYLEHKYNAHTVANKVFNKLQLQRQFGLPVNDRIPLIGMVGRLAEQKGIDLVLESLPKLLQQPLQLVILGSGQQQLEQDLLAISARHPDQIAIHIGYDESLAHRIEGGADMFLMPSRYEPCGLNQIYSLRYGTPPIVRRTGGLANTIIDATPALIKQGTATGFMFNKASAKDLTAAVERALALYQQPRLWNKLVFATMQQDFSWRRSAKHYLDLYKQAEEIKKGLSAAD